MQIASPDRIEDHIGSKYALVIVAAKRARQLKDGATPLVRGNSSNVLTVALEEIAARKVIPVGEDDPAAGTS